MDSIHDKVKDEKTAETYQKVENAGQTEKSKYPIEMHFDIEYYDIKQAESLFKTDEQRDGEVKGSPDIKHPKIKEELDVDDDCYSEKAKIICKMEADELESNNEIERANEIEIDNEFESGNAPIKVEIKKESNVKKENGIKIETVSKIETGSKIETISQIGTTSKIGKRFECKTCSDMFATETRLKSHRLKWHSQKAQESQSKDSLKATTSTQSTKETTRKNLKQKKKAPKVPCTVCKKLVSKVQMKLHLLRHAGVRFPCDICGKSFAGANSLHIHRTKHSNIRYTCETCQKTFIDMSSLKKHSLTHTNVRFPCEICDDTFAYRSSLRKHLAKHTNARLACKQCPKTFKLKESLRFHMLRHEGKFPCTSCTGVFSSKSDLYEHKVTVIHKRETVYVCQHCNKVFPVKEHLRVHMKEHA